MSSIELDQPSIFEITINELGDIVNFDRRSDKTLLEVLNENYNGIEGLANLLGSDLVNGISLRFPHQINSPIKGSR
jgi:hypothetical protein